jgi:carbon storage regulator
VLVLTRRSNESIVIGENIVVTILGVDGEKVKLGIDAPRQVQILRMELFTAIQQQGRLVEHLAAGEEPASFQNLRTVLNDTDEKQ